MKPGPTFLLGMTVIVLAQLVRGPANAMDDRPKIEEPYAPSPEAARIISVGYNELAADLLFFRLVGYFGDKHSADGIASLVEAIVTLDPHHYKAYVWGSQAMVHGATRGVGRDHFLRAIKLLEKGLVAFPNDHAIPRMAGEIYLLDLKTDDPAERRTWDDTGTALLESAVRKPNAPAELGTYIAHLRSKLGQQERAKSGLRELILITDDVKAREALLAKLAELQGTDSADVAIEVLDERRRFEAQWLRERPYMPPSLYILLGPTPQPGFDPADLATGGRDLVGADFVAPLEPLTP